MNVSPSSNTFVTLQWLKIAHLLFSGMWIGGSLCLVLMLLLFHAANSTELYTEYALLTLLDKNIIAVGAIGAFTTGALYAMLTPLGLVKQWWIIAKWMTLSCYIIFGFLVFIPWSSSIMASSAVLPIGTPIMNTSLDIEAMHIIMAVGQTLVVIFFISVSIFKPWGRTPFTKHSEYSKQHEA